MRHLWDYYKKQTFFYKNRKNIKIYDCFLFFNENDLLETRLNELYSVVDYFVIFESCFTFTKKSKGFLLDIERFKKFKDKIIYIQNSDFIKSPNPWQFEYYQRNKIIDSIKEANIDDMIILSDLDEIPRKDKIIQAFYDIYNLDKHYIKLKLKNYHYALNNEMNENADWIGPVISKKKYINSMQEFRHAKDYHLIDNAGWHYSFLSSPEDIIFKMKSYSHKEHDRWPNNDINFIKQRINDGKSHFGNQEHTFRIVELNKKNCPKYVLKNIKKYDKLIFKHEKTSIWSQIVNLYNQKICQVKKYTLGLRNKSS